MPPGGREQTAIKSIFPNPCMLKLNIIYIINYKFFYQFVVVIFAVFVVHSDCV